jgi:hypothetical protein
LVSIVLYSIVRMSMSNSSNKGPEYEEEHEESRVQFSPFIQVLPSAEAGFDHVDECDQPRTAHAISEASFNLLQAEEASLGSLPGYVGASATELQVSEPTLLGIEDYEDSISRYVLAATHSYHDEIIGC